MTKTQDQIEIDLNTLIGQRYNKRTLAEAIQEITGGKVMVENISKKESELTDYNYVFHIDNPEMDIHAFGDIYFLKMRCKDFNGAKFQVTSVSIRFE
jgi:hypothetical protein